MDSTRDISMFEARVALWSEPGRRMTMRALCDRTGGSIERISAHLSKLRSCGDVRCERVPGERLLYVWVGGEPVPPAPVESFEREVDTPSQYLPIKESTPWDCLLLLR